MQWTRRRQKTNDVGSRTAKSCGPGAPTLASSFAKDNSRGDGDNKARSPGRARRKPLKPLRREGWTAPANLWWLCSCAFFIRTRGCGCVEHPAFPAPSIFRGTMSVQGSGEVHAARGRTLVCFTIW